MPYIIESTKQENIFPDICPYCEKRKPETTFIGNYTKATGLIPIPGATFVTYDSYHTGYPICDTCSKRLFILKILSILLIIVPWIVYIVSFVNAYSFDNIMFKITWASTFLAILLYIYRQWLIFRFRIGYINKKGTYFYSRSKSYAEMFSKLNGLTFEYKLVQLILFCHIIEKHFHIQIPVVFGKRTQLNHGASYDGFSFAL